jgi:hypothetical protein
MKHLFSRGFWALDADKAIDRAVNGCHTCAALMKVPTRFIQQSTTVPPDEGIGKRFTTDVIRREMQFILLIKEYVSAYCDACFLPGEKATDLEDGITRLMAKFRAPSGPPVTIRTDQGSCFKSLNASKSLANQCITLELGEVKNINKNPSGEKAISELHSEIVRLKPGGGPLDEVTLSLAVSNLNSRIRHGGLSASEVWYQRDMHTGEQLPVRDIEVIRSKAASRIQGHLPSAKYKARGSVESNLASTSPGDIVYLYQDRDKTRSRDKYIVIHSDKQMSKVQKFVGSQLRSKVYEVNNADIIRVKPYIFPSLSMNNSADEYKFPLNSDLVDDNPTQDGVDDVEEDSASSVSGDASLSEAAGESDEEDEDPQNQDGGEESSDAEVDNSGVSVVGEEEVGEAAAEGVRKSNRIRKNPAWFKTYHTGKRLSQVVPRI